MTRKREHIDLSAFWDTVDENLPDDSERGRQRIAAALSRAAAESSGIAWQGLLTVREDWAG